MDARMSGAVLTTRRKKLAEHVAEYCKLQAEAPLSCGTVVWSDFMRHLFPKATASKYSLGHKKSYSAVQKVVVLADHLYLFFYYSEERSSL